MAGLNVLMPRSLRDTKVAELQLTDSLEDTFIDIANKIQGMDDTYKEALLKRIILEFVPPVMGIDLCDYINRISVDAARYLANHKEELASDEDRKSALMALRKTIEK